MNQLIFKKRPGTGECDRHQMIRITSFKRLGRNAPRVLIPHGSLSNYSQQLCTSSGTAPRVNVLCAWPEHSLIQLIFSLFLEEFSLLICLGNCAKSLCSAGVSSHQIGFSNLKIAKFPVKFPVSREFAWRRVRTALRRQPASHSTTDS
jgi:hypothetical protein